MKVLQRILLVTWVLLATGCFRAVSIPADEGGRRALSADLIKDGQRWERAVEIHATNPSDGTRHWLVVRLHHVDVEGAFLRGTVREDFVHVGPEALAMWVAVPDAYGKTIQVEFVDMTSLNVLGVDEKIAKRNASEVAGICLALICGAAGGLR